MLAQHSRVCLLSILKTGSSLAGTGSGSVCVEVCVEERGFLYIVIHKLRLW